MDEHLNGINDNSRIIRENNNGSSNRSNLTLSNEDNHQLIDNNEDEQSIINEQNDNEQRLPNQMADSTLVLHPIKITALYIAELAYLIDPKTKKPAKYDCPHCSKPICPKKGKQHITLDRSCKSCVEYDYCSHCTIRANQWRGKITMLYQHASTVPIDFIFVDATAGCDHRIRCEKCGHYKFCFSSHSCKKKDFLPLSAFDFASPNFNSPTPTTSSPSSSSSPSPTLLSPATIHTHTPSPLSDHANPFASPVVYHANSNLHLNNINNTINHSNNNNNIINNNNNNNMINYNHPSNIYASNQQINPLNVNINNNINNNIDSSIISQNENNENPLKLSNTSSVIMNSNISNLFSPLETLSFSPNSYETALAFEPPMPFNFDSPSLNTSNNINLSIINNNNIIKSDTNVINNININNNNNNNNENEHEMEHDVDVNNHVPMDFSHGEEANDAIDYIWKNTFGTMNDVDKMTFSHFISRFNIDGFGWEILKTTSLVADDDVFRESMFKDWFRRLGSKPDSQNPYQAWCYFLYRVSQVAEAIIECANIQTHSLSILKSNHHPESIVLSWNPRNNENEKRFRIRCTESGFRLYKDPLMRNYAYQDQSLTNIIHKFINEH